MDERKSDLIAKVPQVTLLFWIIKILATTLGETGGDAVTMSWLGETTAAAKGTGYLFVLRLRWFESSPAQSPLKGGFTRENRQTTRFRRLRIVAHENAANRGLRVNYSSTARRLHLSAL